MNRPFFSWVKSSTSAKKFAVVALLLCLAYYALEAYNGRSQMADFRVYYDAANAFLYDQQVYGVAFGVSSGFYKYSPFACLPFVPLAILPYGVASFIYYVIISLSVIGFMLYLVYFFSEKKNKNTGWILAAISLFMADHLERELHLGNVNLFLLMLCFLLFEWSTQGSKIKAGIIYGIVLLFKPHFAILLPYFIWKMEWKKMFAAVVTIIIGLFLPALIKGWTNNMVLLQQWSAAMRDHNMKLEESPNTIYGILNRFVLMHSGGSWLILVVLAIVGLLFIWLMIQNAKQHGKGKMIFIEYFLLIALIPNLAHTDTEHFMWTWPLIAYVIVHLFDSAFANKKLIVAIMCLAFVPYCLNSPDIVGRDLRFLFDEGGLLGVANLLIIGAAVFVFKQNQKTDMMAV